MADNVQKIKDMISEKPMTLSDISHKLSISHRQAKKALHRIQGVKFATHEDRRYYSLTSERLEKIEPSKTMKSGRPAKRRSMSMPSIIDSLPFDKRSVMVYLIVMIAISIFLKSAIDIFPIGDERLYAAAGVQAINGKSFIYEHPPVAHIFFGMATYFMPLDYSMILQLPGNWYYGVSHPAVVSVLGQALPGMRIVPIIFSFLLAGVMFHYSRRLYGTRAALLVFFMATLSINMLLFSTALMMEIVMMFFGTTTILFYVLDYMPNRTQKNALILFILMTLTLGTRSFTPFILFGVVVIAELARSIKNRRIDPVIWVALVASVIAFFAYYPFQNMSLAYQQFTIISSGGRNMFVPMFSHITLLVMLFVPVALYKYFGGLAGGKKIRGSFHVLFLAAIITGAFSLYIGKFRYAVIALPFLYMVMPFAFRKSGAALKNIAIALAALALVSSFYYFPYFDSFNNLVSRGIGIYNVDSRDHLIHSYSYIEQIYSGQSLWTDSPMLIYSSIPMTGFYDYDVALDVNGNVLSEGALHSNCKDADTMASHVEEIGYDLFIETDDAIIEARCPGLKELLEQTETVYSDQWTDIYKF
jgi:hypothetical protein